MTTVAGLNLLQSRQPSVIAVNRTPDTSCNDRIANPPEEAGRQIAIAHRRLTTSDWTNIVARPREPVPLGDDDPRSVTGKPQVAPDSLGHLDRQLIAGRDLGGQRHDVHLIDPVLRTGHQNDGNGPVLYTFIATFNVLVFPQVAVVEDFTRLRQR